MLYCLGFGLVPGGLGELGGLVLESGGGGGGGGLGWGSGGGGGGGGWTGCYFGLGCEIVLWLGLAI